MKHFPLLFTLLFISIFSFGQSTNHCDASEQEAQFHFGEEITICGKVVQLYRPKYTKGDPIFLNFGSSYPNHSFTAVIWGDVFQKEFSEALVKYYFGKNLAIYGKIKEYQGKPTIQIKEKSQITVLENYDQEFIKIKPRN